MSARRVLAIGLDGYEASLGDRLMAAGELPALAALRRRSACFLLDHGPAQRTGLAWEHVSSGLAPEAGGRWAPVCLDPASYAVWQEGTSLTPFPGRLDARTVVFDAPYFDLARAPAVEGIVNWGAHDPGAATGARPAALLSEFEARFGAYPAKDSIYGFVWPSAERCRRTGEVLARAAEVRAQGARWLLGERLPEWDLAMVVTGELHSAIECLWHGVDETHPLHRLPSAGPAGEGLRAVYRAVDRLVGTLIEAFPDATAVVFATGGMGPNLSDVASMALLPELLYRHAFGRPLMRQHPAWGEAPGGIATLDEDANWSRDVNALIPEERSARTVVRRSVSRFVPARVKRMLRGETGTDPAATSPVRLSLGWMPATRYQPYWPAMRAFALPSFYDGRIRINLAGRERNGSVRPSEYEAVCDEIEALVRACRDPATGEGAVDYFERPGRGRDPRTLGPTESDLNVIWRGPLALDHPTLGRVGPLPYRRTGGHTGLHGLAYCSGPGIAPGDRGARSTFDVVPTLVELVGAAPVPGLSGVSLLAASA
jgi:predicted AlkP superfamily phosphohydrolase/phosphomutase